MLKHCDSELAHVMDETVPPLDLMHIGAFRSAILRWQKQDAWRMSLNIF